jgi:hypothetical protein
MSAADPVITAAELAEAGVKRIKSAARYRGSLSRRFSRARGR